MRRTETEEESAEILGKFYQTLTGTIKCQNESNVLLNLVDVLGKQLVDGVINSIVRCLCLS